jgi:hypothetical protein
MREFIRTAAVPIVKLRLNQLRWKVQAQRTSACDVISTSVLPSHLRVCGWDTSRARVGNGGLKMRYYLWRHNHVRKKWLDSDALLFIAPQPRS